tara:strand:+ start:1414 stop:1968 length:555 start_codon:yes stop_codon:yes gene_type:complete
MHKASKKSVWAALTLSIVLSISFSSDQISPRLKEKIDAAIHSTYGITDFELKRIAVQSEWDKRTPAALGGENLFEIFRAKQLHGYLYLGEAPSKKRKFDYVILFTPNFTVKKTKVLIYREDFGQQIGSQRWLKQFIGFTLVDHPSYGENIDAISGATISASSMTRAIGDVLTSLRILKEKELIP